MAILILPIDSLKNTLFQVRLPNPDFQPRPHHSLAPPIFLHSRASYSLGAHIGVSGGWEAPSDPYLATFLCPLRNSARVEGRPHTAQPGLAGERRARSTPLRGENAFNFKSRMPQLDRDDIYRVHRKDVSMLCYQPV
eukprot:752435-Hanusia_phi.AAC.3